MNNPFKHAVAAARASGIDGQVEPKRDPGEQTRYKLEQPRAPSRVSELPDHS
jgi:hypothetical protein